jgi:ABC-type polysaccharide/polyol phosphate transport system ATPase subunit
MTPVKRLLRRGTRAQRAGTTRLEAVAAAHGSAPAVVVDGVSKSFRIPHERISTLKERVLHPLKRTTHERFDALQGVTFAVERGEFFGIVGRNGSGKSTLLKCMAGIYRVDEGEIYLSPDLALG